MCRFERRGFTERNIVRYNDKIKFHFPSLLVASANDPYSTISTAQSLADNWGCAFINVGNLGHINADSAIADWKEGFNLFESFIKKINSDGDPL